MTLETILQILFANNLENVVALATKIDHNITEEQPIEITSLIRNSDLPQGFELVDAGGRKESIGKMPCPVISTDKYALTNRYTIQLPNGKYKKVPEEVNNGYSELYIRSIPEPATDTTIGVSFDQAK